MKKQLLSCIFSVYALVAIAGETSPEAGSKKNNSAAVPAFDWVKSEIQKVFSTSNTSGENLGEVLDLNINALDQSQLIFVKGHFTSTENTQYIVTVPASAKNGKDLGWETNVWMLVERNADQSWSTLSTMRGDIAYQNSLVDIDGDGLMEVSMVNKTSNENAQTVSYKIYSFKNNGFIYSAETKDCWSNHKIARRKHLDRNEMLYNTLQVQVVDTDNDGVKEIVETWTEFRYNGGRRVATIEQKKNMVVITNVLKWENGKLAATKS